MSNDMDEAAIRHDERKKIIAQGCIHTRKASENADHDRPDLSQWQHDQSEYFDPTILEIVSEYAAWRDGQQCLSPAPDRGEGGGMSGTYRVALAALAFSAVFLIACLIAIPLVSAPVAGVHQGGSGK